MPPLPRPVPSIHSAAPTTNADKDRLMIEYNTLYDTLAGFQANIRSARDNRALNTAGAAFEHTLVSFFILTPSFVESFCVESISSSGLTNGQVPSRRVGI
jgi:hypothetical protein